MLKVGLTGGIASGKSTVAKYFEALGTPVIYADIIAREVVAVGSDGLRAVHSAFGDNVIDSHGELNRAALREIVFSDAKKRKQLEGILHPLIRTRSDELEALAKNSGAAYVVFEIPLLLETGRYKDMDRVLVVDVQESTQITRVMQRDNCSETQAIKILAVQSGRQDRLAIADDIIKNEGELQELKSAVTELHERYLTLATI